MSGLIQRRKRRHKEHSEGYWPGYVDALTNVVLNLLFLVAILAAGVFSLGMEASRKALLPAAGELQRRVNQVLGRAATSIEVGKPAAVPDVLHVKLDAVRQEGGRILLQITFDGDALVLGAADKAVLLPQIKAEYARLEHASVAVWTVSDADPGNQRASYMRVMAVRDHLGEAGVDVRQVVTRILPGASQDRHVQRVYVVFNRNRKSDDNE